MDLSIYNAMLTEAGVDPFEFDPKKKRKYPKGERTFRHDIFKGKTIWVNNKKEDFKLFIRSFHPLFGLFTVCDHHPYTKRKRLLTLLVMLLIGSFWAALSAYFTKQSEDPSDSMTTVEVYSIKFIISIINGTLLTLTEVCLRHLQSCSCAENKENGCCYCLCKCFARCAVCLWSCIALTFFAFMIVLVSIGNIVGQFFFIFSLQFIISWLLQILGLYLKFRGRWKKDIKMMKQLNEVNDENDLQKDNDDVNDDGITTSPSAFRLIRTKLKKKKKKPKKICPYYITYEDYERWIVKHPEHIKDSESMVSPLLSSFRMFTADKNGNKQNIIQNIEFSSDSDSHSDDNSVNKHKKNTQIEMSKDSQ